MDNDSHTETQRGDLPVMRQGVKIPFIPASAFGIVLGAAGFAGSWRAAAGFWHLPVSIGIWTGRFSVAIWLVLIVLYAAKWLFFTKEAQEEVQHPVQCCFVGLSGVATMLAAGALQADFPATATVVFWLGAVAAIGYAIWKVGGLWRGGRDVAATTAALYLPLAAGFFVLTIVGSEVFGYRCMGQLSFGAGFFSWLAIESVLLHRLLTAPELAEPLRPTSGIQLAPPAVGMLAYLSITPGPPDAFVHALLGYAILQALLLLRMLPWVARQPFAASYWAFTFGATALASGVIKMAGRGGEDLLLRLAPIIFVVVNAVIIAIAVLSLHLLVRGKLFPMRRLAAD